MANKRRNPTVRPRAKIHRNGNMTISGIPYREFRHLMNMAAIHWYDNPFKPDKVEPGCLWPDVIELNNKLGEMEHRFTKWILDRIDDEVSDAIKATFRKPNRPGPTLKQLLLKRNQERKWIREAIERIQQERKERERSEYCGASRDGEDCSHPNCPQIRDGEPEKSGRSCPLKEYEEL